MILPLKIPRRLRRGVFINIILYDAEHFFQFGNSDEFVKSPEKFCDTPQEVLLNQANYNILWCKVGSPTFYETVNSNIKKQTEET
jgi:hypothetical protein